MYLSLYLHVTKAEAFPVSLRIAVLGSLIGLWTCFFINNFIKISAHAAGMGGLVLMMALTQTTFGYAHAQIGLIGGINLVVPMNSLFYGAILMAGVVCTSRLILKAHEPREVYLGFIAGVLSIGIAFIILM
jgi:hypothetical protein